MIALTVTPDAANAVALLTVTGAVGAVTITATPERYRLPYTVRQTGTGTPDPLNVTDYEVPLGVTVYYSVSDTAAGVATAVLPPIESAGAVLASTWTPANRTGVVVLEDAPHDVQARSAFFDVIGRPDPLVAVDVMRYRSGTLTFYAGGYDARTLLYAVLAPGEPLLLRTPCHETVDDVIFLAGNVTEDPHVDNTGGRLFRVDYQAVTRTLGPYNGTTDWAYGNLPATYADYAALRAAYASYALLVFGPAAPAAVVTPGMGWSLVL